LKNLLRLQALDLDIRRRRLREAEIPKQKLKFAAHTDRLNAELKAREEDVKRLKVEQHGLETDIEQMQQQIAKYDTQLLGVKKNEEYQALLHEIDGLKKQVSQKEERILELMESIEKAQALLAEERERIGRELAEIDRQCKEIDAELAEAVAEREELEAGRDALVAQADPALLRKYERIRKSKPDGVALVPLRGETCSGCNMSVLPQAVNEVLGGEVLACNHCGRLLYDKGVVGEEAEARAE
jgi:hypothetical protein